MNGDMDQKRQWPAKIWRSDGLAGGLLRGATGSLAARIAEVLLGLLLLVLLARGLDAEGLGVYAFSLAFVSVLSVIVLLGLPPLVVRETARGQAVNDWGPVRGLWRWAHGLALSISLALGIILAIVLWSGAVEDELLRHTLLWGVPLIPIFVLIGIRSAVLRGLRHVVAGIVPGLVIRPALLIVLVSLVLLMPGVGLTPALTMGLTVFAAFFALGCSAWWLRRIRPVTMAKAAPVYDPGRWFAAAWPLALLQGFDQINRYVDLMLLGSLAGNADVGIYRVAAQGALLASLGLTALAMAIAPFVTRLYHRREYKKLQKLARRAAQAAVIFAVPAVVGFAVIGDYFLVTLFGPEFGAAYWPLLILATGHLVSAAFGVCGLLLNMTDHERDVSHAVVAAAVLNVLANVLLIPEFGMIGAAIATTLSLVTWNLWLWTRVKARLGIRSSVF